MKKFLERFNFRKEGSLLVGVERESFLTDEEGNISPIAPKVLERLGINDQFGYELSACQLEDRVGPVELVSLKSALIENDSAIEGVQMELGFRRVFHEVAPSDMPLDIYPDPTGRYQEITKNMPHEILLAACRVAGVHVHIGMPDHESALRVYNQVRRDSHLLCNLGDKSKGERLAIYKIMEPDFDPPHYESWEDFYGEAVRKGFVHDPRKCWHIIRLSVHGTIEFRMFGSTSSISEIVRWATICHRFCQEALT